MSERRLPSVGQGSTSRIPRGATRPRQNLSPRLNYPFAPVFHERTTNEDDAVLSNTLWKLARKTGTLNLANKGMARGELPLPLIISLVAASLSVVVTGERMKRWQSILNMQADKVEQLQPQQQRPQQRQPTWSDVVDISSLWLLSMWWSNLTLTGHRRCCANYTLRLAASVSNISFRHSLRTFDRLVCAVRLPLSEVLLDITRREFPFILQDCVL